MTEDRTDCCMDIECEIIEKKIPVQFNSHEHS